MTSWREQIIKRFISGRSLITIVIDPDQLFSNPELQDALRNKGFGLVFFHDQMTLRFVYENEFRNKWDEGEKTEMLIVFPHEASQVDSLPSDLTNQAQIFSFGLDDLFPNLAPEVSRALPIDCLDQLQEAIEKFQPGEMSLNNSLDFVLEHVYGIVKSRLNKPVELYHELISMHYAKKQLPKILNDRLVFLAGQHQESFPGLQLAKITGSAKAFFSFLQERWQIFVQATLVQKGLLVQEPIAEMLDFSGPRNFPFDAPEIRSHLPVLFNEGLLCSVQVARKWSDSQSGKPQPKDTIPEWILCGLSEDAANDRQNQLEWVMKKMASSLPTEENSIDDWLAYHRLYARARYLRFNWPLDELPEETVQKHKALSNQANEVFWLWLKEKYSQLFSLPPANPKMLHHLPRYMARRMNSQDKVALLVIDGLAYDQWLAIRKDCLPVAPHYNVNEKVLMAWLPTLTSFSRQALFAGAWPANLAETILTTSKEPKHWENFWKNEGIDSSEIFYCKCLGKPESSEDLFAKLEKRNYRILGLVIDTVDSIMHGAELGLNGVFQQLKLWAEMGFLRNLITRLIDKGFQIIITSDHGNTETHGIGSPQEGAIAESRGLRTRIYSDKVLRDQVFSKFPKAMVWPGAGLPESSNILFAPYGKSFSHEGQIQVTHGGPSLEELIVPMIEISGSF